jgi:hypothetical protein
MRYSLLCSLLVTGPPTNTPGTTHVLRTPNPASQQPAQPGRSQREQQEQQTWSIAARGPRGCSRAGGDKRQEAALSKCNLYSEATRAQARAQARGRSARSWSWQRAGQPLGLPLTAARIGRGQRPLHNRCPPAAAWHLQSARLSADLALGERGRGGSRRRAEGAAPPSSAEGAVLPSSVLPSSVRRARRLPVEPWSGPLPAPVASDE